MDILDIMLARAMTPQGKTDAYVAKANKAAQKAAKAQEDAEAAIATVTAAAEDIEETQASITSLLEDAQEALETAQQASINMPEVYTTTGQNTDGYMTQKAVTDALAAKADSTTLNSYATTTYVDNGLAAKANSSALNDYATKQYVTQQISSIPVGSGNGDPITYGIDNAGKMIMVGANGTSTVSSVTESAIIEALIKSGTYSSNGIIGLEIDYENKSFARLQDAYGKSAGADFNSYKMYGGRMRCNVADDGTINAFYGDPTYIEDGSNGEVMVYQPKFYYERLILKTEYSNNGTVIRKEALLLSDEPRTGFKLHPLFLDGENELDYALLPAYEGSVENDKLNSRAGKKPISNTVLTTLENYARAHGTGWDVTNMAFESAIQMLEIVEFGNMNGQNSLDKGICNISDVDNYNCASLTGSTTGLGNTSGIATETINEVNGTQTTYNESGKRAISYRGMENPWGNIWRMISGAKVIGSNTNNGGTVYIYSGTGYQSVGFNLPSVGGYISAIGYSNDYDWLYIPIECQNANSAMPVGDSIWTTPNPTKENIVAVGGKWNFEEQNGPFAYAFDQNNSSQKSYGARLMFKPTKNNIYTANIAAWAAKMG